ncbi:MAG: Murein DD-endopeptidase MepM and murein hydrolase activator NlpD, containing LysM domain, partial [Pelagibacterales bacterium]|nr:Murein DD-endopeptidase MepM and murein hydrolase activator NlpD, containing LysM domain [Pelagibacterales bacterium]
FKSYSTKKEKNFNNFVNSNEFNNIKNYLFDNLKSPYKEYSYIIKRNDTLDKILKQYKVLNTDITLLLKEIQKKDVSEIFVGQTINMVTKEDQGLKRIISLSYSVTPIISIEARRDKDRFVVNKNILQLKKKETVVKNIIKNNLYSSAIEVGIEPNIIIEFARIYGFEVDFQRDIRKGDWFEIYYEKYIDENDQVKNTGKILYASMYVNNKELALYNFNYKKDSGFYDVDGKSVVKALMKTPINGARLSSSFGMRKHPILGFNKLHTGTDFAAKSGTPIMASGSGTVTRARWCGAGGNCVKIRHNSVYETVYAHMKSFAKGIKEGRKVRQGQVIGYVGSTGRSTGPHLHYEVIVNKKKVNSQKLKLPSGKILGDNARQSFEIERIKTDVKLAELRGK